MNQLITDPAYDAAEEIVSPVDISLEISQNSNSISNNSEISLTYDSIGNIIRATENNNIRDYSYNAHQVTFIENKTFNNSCTGSSPPNFGNWVVASLTTCLLSKVHLSQNSNLTVRSELTLNNSNVTLSGKLVLNGKLSLSNSKVIFKTSSSPSGDSLSYDANGNLISGWGYKYEYNDANQLVRVNDSYSAVIAQYWYYPNGERFERICLSGVTTFYIGKDYETKVNSSGSFDTAYYYANGELLSRKDSNGQRFFYHNDHLTGTNVVTDSAGNLAERTRYYPFGKILEGGTSSRLFTGQKWDNYWGYSGVYYYGARYYNPELSRFTQPDSIIQDFYNPQSLNRYSYVENNPLSYVDPSGNGKIGIAIKLITGVVKYGSLGMGIAAIQSDAADLTKSIGHQQQVLGTYGGFSSENLAAMGDVWLKARGDCCILQERCRRCGRLAERWREGSWAGGEGGGCCKNGSRTK